MLEVAGTRSSCPKSVLPFSVRSGPGEDKRGAREEKLNLAAQISKEQAHVSCPPSPNVAIAAVKLLKTNTTQSRRAVGLDAFVLLQAIFFVLSTSSAAHPNINNKTLNQLAAAAFPRKLSSKSCLLVKFPSFDSCQTRRRVNQPAL